MVVTGLKQNIVYSSFLTVANFIFPLLVYPYISRVLGVYNIGICNFVDSIINYYILFSMMGIGTTAIREIAKNNDGKEGMYKVFSSLFFLNTLSTFVVLIVLLISIHFVPIFYQYRELMYIGAFKLVFNCLLIEWFYKGIENFKFITQRCIIIRSVYVLLVFLFVKERDDYTIYYTLSVLTIVVNALFNLVYSRRFVRFTFHEISIFTYLNSFIILGVYSLLTSMYTSFNVVYLGFVAGEIEVGYYATSVKMYTVFLSLFTAFTGVMMPRMSSLVAGKEYSEFKRITQRSIDILLLFVSPVIVISIVFAPQIIHIMAGDEFVNAVLPMRLVMPLLFVIGYEQIIIIQILVPLKKDKAVLFNSILGASIGFFMNILIVPELKSIGSSIVWILAEFSVLCSAQFFVQKYTNMCFPFKKVLKYLLLSIPVFTLCYCISLLNISDCLLLLIGGILVLVYYTLIAVFVLKDKIIMILFKREC